MIASSPRIFPSSLSAFSSVADTWLIGSAGVFVEATIVTNIIIVETASDKENRKENP